jgi:hypothetical protein
MKTLRYLVVTVAVAACIGCTLPYSPPQVLDQSLGAIGIVDVLSHNTDVDVLLIHGMCTHGKKWVVAANNSLRKSLGIVEELDESNLPIPHKITNGTESYMEVYTIQGPLAAKNLRTHAILWSPAVAPWKRRLCYDGQQNFDGDMLCGQAVGFQPVRAAINGSVKKTLLNDCLSDAMIYVGEARPLLQQQIWNAVLAALGHHAKIKSFSALKATVEAERTPIFIITSSLGSKILYDTLWKMSSDKGNRQVVQTILGRSAQLFMHANQIPVLSLAAPLDNVQRLADSEKNELGMDTLNALFSTYGNGIREQLTRFRPPRLDSMNKADVVAFTDPNDLLSYFLKGADDTLTRHYRVVDVLVSNSFTYFGLFENPLRAHTHYAERDDVHKIIACGLPINRNCGLKSR